MLALPVAGGSWGSLVIESLIAAAPKGAEPHFFRRAAGAEIDLLLKLPGHTAPWAIEIKRGPAPGIERGFHLACDDVQPGRRVVMYGGTERFPIAGNIDAMPLTDLCPQLLAACSGSGASIAVDMR